MRRERVALEPRSRHRVRTPANDAYMPTQEYFPKIPVQLPVSLCYEFPWLASVGVFKTLTIKLSLGWPSALQLTELLPSPSSSNSPTPWQLHDLPTLSVSK